MSSTLLLRVGSATLRIGVGAGAPTAPAAPSGLAATAISPSRIDLTWADNSTDETGFALERSPDGSAGWTQVASPAMNATAASDTGLAASTVYYYRIRAVNAVGPSAWSGVANATTTGAGGVPANPSNLRVTDSFTIQLRLAWDDNSTDEDNFILEKAADVSGSPGTFSALGTLAANTTTYSDGGLAPSTPAWYRVKARNGVGDSAWAGPVQGTTAAMVVPQDVAVSAIDQTSVSVSWTCADPVGPGFFVEQSADGTTGWAQVGGAIGGLTANVTGLSAGTTYYFRVRSEVYGGGYVSGYSSVASGSTFAVGTPPAATGLAGVGSSSTSIDLSWTDVATDETSYVLERRIGGSGSYAALATLAANSVSYHDSGLSTGQPYDYRLRAVNAVGPGPWAYLLGATSAAADPPRTPEALFAASSSPTTLALDYTTEDSPSIHVEQSPDGTTGWTRILSSLPSGVIRLSGLTPDTDYYYRIQGSIFGTINSGYSNVAHGHTFPSSLSVPSAPSAPGVVVNSATQATLTWTSNSGGTETGFIVERCDDGIAFSEVGRTPSGVTTFVDRRHLTPGEPSIWRVRAYGPGGLSAVTATVTATMDTAVATVAPATPTGLAAYAAADTEMYLEWSVGDEAETHFIVERSPAGAGTWTTAHIVVTGDTTAVRTDGLVPALWTDTYVGNLTASTSYDFRVKAVNAAGSSAYSNVATHSTLATGQVWSPTGRNPRFQFNPRWLANWLAAKAEYEAGDPTFPTTHVAKVYHTLKNRGDVVHTSTESQPRGSCDAVVMYQITGDTDYAERAYLDMEQGNFLLPNTAYNQFPRVFGTPATVLSDAGNTATTFKINLDWNVATAWANQNAYGLLVYDRIWFDTGTNADVAAHSLRIESYDAGTGFVTMTTPFPSTPAPGDTLTVWHVYRWWGNAIRELFLEYVFSCEVLWPYLTSARRTKYIKFLNNLADMGAGVDPDGVGYPQSPYRGTRTGDSDQMQGDSFGTLAWSVASAALGNPRAAALITANVWDTDTSRTVPFGGLDPTGVNRDTIRNTLKQMASSARAGEWLEAREYNGGTLALVMTGIQALRRLTCADHFPEFTGMVRRAARSHLFSQTSDLLYQSKWGDEEHAYGLWSPIEFGELAQFAGYTRGVPWTGPQLADIIHCYADPAQESNAYYISGSIAPWPRYYINFDLSLPRTDFRALAKTVVMGPASGRGSIHVHSDRTATGSLFTAHSFTSPTVDHECHWLNHFQLYRRGERIIRNLNRYGGYLLTGPTWNEDGCGGGLLVNGLSTGKEVQGCVECEVGALEDYAYQVGSTHGYIFDPINEGDRYLFDRIRSLFFLPSVSDATPTLVVYDRVVARDPRKLACYEKYLGTGAGVHATIGAGATTTAIPITIAGRAADDLAGMTVTFTTGANLLVKRMVDSSTATVAGVVTLTLRSALGTAPASGDRLVMNFLTEAPRGIERASGLVEQVIRCETTPTVASDVVSWDTAGGQHVRVQFLARPSDATYATLDEETFYQDPALPDRLKNALWETGDDDDVWLKQVRLSVPRTGDDRPRDVRLLHAWQVFDSGSPVNTRVQSGGGEADGVLVKRPGDPDALVLFGSGPGDRIHYSGFTATWTSVASTTVCYICDLNTNQPWTYALDGGSPATLTPSVAGVGRVAVSGSGSHTLVFAGPVSVARTTAAAGNWSSAATWTGGVVPLPQDTATINHAVTVDIDATSAGLTINAALGVATGKRLTMAGNVVQSDATFTMAAGSALRFDCVAADRKWVVGTTWNQTNAKFVASGTANGGDPAGKVTTTTGGNHCTVDKAGSYACWFDAGDEGSAAFYNCSVWQLAYTDMIGIGKADGSFAIRNNDAGTADLTLDYCSFTACATIFKHSVAWSAAGGHDYRIFRCRWASSIPGSIDLDAYSNGSTGSGLRRIVGNAFDARINLGVVGMAVEDNYFDICPTTNGSPHSSWMRNLIRYSSNGQTLNYVDSTDTNYYLADHVVPGQVGNPHFCQVAAVGTTHRYSLMEMPHAGADGGDGFFGSPMGTTLIEYFLSIPSATDLQTAGNVTNPVEPGNNNTTILHATLVGNYAQAVVIEYDTTAHTRVAALKSSILAAPASAAGLQKAMMLYDGSYATLGYSDQINPAGITNMWLENPYRGGTTVGAVGAFSTAPAGPITATDNATGSYLADFVDATRNFAAWAVYKGAASSGATLRQKIDAGRALCLADPTMGMDAFDWVWAGFAPRNPALNHTAHDGTTIGAVPYAGV